MIIFGTFIACSQDKQNMENINTDKIKITEIVQNLTDYMVQRDVEKIDEILDDDFTLTHITGYIQPKEEWLGEIKKETMKYYTYEKVKESVKIDGNKATFLSQNILDARIWGTRNRWRLQQIFQLEKRNGRWLITSSVASLF